jgi:hypothetical protein
MTPKGLIFLLEQAENGKEWAVDFINERTEWEDFKTFDMETIYRFSQVADVDMIEFFEPVDMYEAGYMSYEDYSDGVYANMHAEEI